MKSVTPDRPIGIFYEHPEWFRPLFAELERRGIPFEKLEARSHRFDPSQEPPWLLVFNRMSPSAGNRGAGHAIFYTTSWLANLEEHGTRVVNGRQAWLLETSKAHQLALLQRLGLPYPAARVIHEPSEAPAAARHLRFPVVVKPNVGGSGTGVRRFDTPEALRAAVRGKELDLGIDHTGLVQELIPREGESIVRVETLGGRYLYAIRVYASEDTFDLCPADFCRQTDGVERTGGARALDAAANGPRVEGYEPPPEVVKQVERITAAAGLDLGGVEYLEDARDGQLYYYDVNALSNFVVDAHAVVGFDPWVPLVDWLEAEAKLVMGTGREAA